MTRRSQPYRGPRRKKRVVEFVGLDGLRFVVDEKPLVNAAGRKMATKLRQRIRRGMDGTGGPLPQAEPGHTGQKKPPPKKPLRRTGQLLKSIKWNAKKRVIAPTNDSQRDDSNLSNGALFAVLVYGRRDWLDHDSKGRIDPLRVTPEIEQVAADAVDKELEKQTAKGKAGLTNPEFRRGAAQSLVGRMRSRGQ